MTDSVYQIEIAGVVRQLPKLTIAPGVQIAILNILGDTELVEASADALAAKTAQLPCSVIVTPETKSIALAHALAVRLRLPYIVLRKERKSYMGDTLSATTESITTSKIQTLFMDAKDRALVHDKQVMLVDDVISTGSTLAAMRKLVSQAGGSAVANVAILTEGDADQWKDVISLGHVPVWSSS